MIDLVILLSAAAAAASPYNVCIVRAGGVTASVSDCQQADLARADGQLNAAYAITLSRLPADRRETLRAQERRWIASRDQRCLEAAQADVGGTAAGLAAQDCRIRETTARTAVLNIWR